MNTDKNCKSCHEMRCYVNDMNAMCGKCHENRLGNGDHNDIIQLINLIDHIGPKVACQFSEEVPLVELKSTDPHSDLNKLIKEKMEGAILRTTSNNDIYVSIVVSQMYITGRTTNKYYLALHNKRLLKETYDISDENIDKLSRLIVITRGVSVYALYEIPANNSDPNSITGNSIAEYCKFKKIMNLLTKTN